MGRIGYAVTSFLTLSLLVTGCASFKPVDLNSQIKSGQLVQKTNNVVVLFDKSASMSESHFKPVLNFDVSDEPITVYSRLKYAKDTTKRMTVTIPDVKLNTGLRTFWREETKLIYGMAPLVKDDYMKAIGTIENAVGRTDMGKAITAAGNDLRGAEGSSAIIIVSDFSEVHGIDDIRPATVMDSITKVNADYGDKLCVYAVQVGYTPDGKELSEQIVQNVVGGYTVNADKLENPTAMAAFVGKVLTGDCSRYQELFAKQKPKVVIVESEPMVEEKVAAVAAETKTEEKVVILAFEDVHFDFDKSTLKPEAQAILKRNVQVLKDNPKAKVRIAGYTSMSGTHAYNQRLSERRANAVQKYLINEGIITQERLSTIGYGETNPAMHEAAPKEIYSKEAKANMRVLFEIRVE